MTEDEFDGERTNFISIPTNRKYIILLIITSITSSVHFVYQLVGNVVELRHFDGRNFQRGFILYYFVYVLCFSRFVFVFVNYLIVRNAGQPGLGIFYLFTGASGLEQCHEHILNAVLDTVGAVFKLKTAKAFYVFSVKMPDLHTLFRNFIFLQINQFQIIPLY